MKNISQILTHLKYSPSFKKLSAYTTLQKLINTLPLELKKGIKFAYVKHETLFFVLTHQVYKAEFIHQKTLIWSLLNSLKIAHIIDIKFFVTNNIEKKEKKVEKNIFYTEKSYGIFENNLKDELLNKKIENIREIIKKNQLKNTL